jgi:DNA-binding SARP family transcriptional activator
MEFRVLGPLEVRRDDLSVELRGSKRRAVLALLVLHANEVVRADRLIDDVWGEEPPANAAAALRNHVSRLRKDLGGEVLVTKPWGYVLRTDPEAIDLRHFERLVAEAKPLAAHERTDLLAEALALWRGPALADLLQEPALAAEIPRLEELRLAAIEQRIDADLELGRHDELVPELEALVAEQPLRERFRGQLILALYRSGRQAEALETYRETRRVLVEELGIEPSSELRELERAILRQDPALVSAPRPQAPVAVEPARSRWRWPRSPLTIAAGLLLLAGAVVAATMIAARGGASGDGGTATVAYEDGPGAPPRPDANQSVTAAPVVKKQAHKSSRASGSTSMAQPAIAASSSSGGREQRPTAPQKATANAPKRLTKPPERPASAANTNTNTNTSPRSVPTRPYLLTDNFDDPLFDFSFWHRATDGIGWDFAEREGRLEIGLAADSVLGGPWNSVEGHYGTMCWLLGDFDARVEYELLTWPERSGANLYLGAYRAKTTANVSRFSYAVGDGYGSWFEPNFLSVPTADTVGALRLRRRDGVLATYYRHAGSWVKTGWARTPGATIIVLQLGSGSDFSHQAVRVAFDNFKAEAEGVDCPNGIPTPPRKPSP